MINSRSFNWQKTFLIKEKFDCGSQKYFVKHKIYFKLMLNLKLNNMKIKSFKIFNPNSI